MQDIEAELRREEAVRALLPVFFASGATGLVYQTLWARELHLVFGTSSFAISTVLSAFMAGLAVGGFVAARRADTVRSPLVAYGLLEIGIGVYSALFPYLVDGLEPVYLWAWRAFEPPPVLFGTIQALLVGSALVIPTGWARPEIGSARCTASTRRERCSGRGSAASSCCPRSASRSRPG